MFAAVQDIVIAPNRQRIEFEAQAMQDLVDSISRLGLLQPVVVRKTDEGLVLVAGERRLRAVVQIQELGGTFRHAGVDVVEGQIPIVHLGDLSPLDAFEAELEENIRRMDLTWQEKATALAKLNELRGRQNPEHTLQDLAVEVTGRGDGIYSDSIKKQLLVARHLDDPDVAGAKTAKDAFKIIVAKEKVENNELRAAMVGLTFGSHVHQLYLGDCLEVMATLDVGQFDCICTDPPYGMGADSFGDAAGKLLTIDHQYDDSLSSFVDLMVPAARLMTALAKPQAHLYICCDIDQFQFLKVLLTDHKWNVFRTPLINVKTGGGRVPLPEHGPRRSYETILYAFRGGRKVNGIYSDVMYTTGDENLGHGAQKPIELYIELLKRSVNAGDRILDPFAGTGTVFPAAHSLRCAAVGVELEPAYYGIAVKRIEELK